MYKFTDLPGKVAPVAVSPGTPQSALLSHNQARPQAVQEVRQSYAVVFPSMRGSGLRSGLFWLAALLVPPLVSTVLFAEAPETDSSRSTEKVGSPFEETLW